MTFLDNLNCYNENSYSDLKNFMDNSYVELSFFGRRIVYSVGSEFSITYEELISKINSLANSNLQISQEEREIGKDISSKLVFFYDILDHKEERASFITRIFIFLLHIDGIADGNNLYNAYLNIPSFES